MNKSVLTVVRLVFFSLMLVALVVLMILNIVENGIKTGTDKILLAMFIVLTRILCRNAICHCGKRHTVWPWKTRKENPQMC